MPRILRLLFPPLAAFREAGIIARVIGWTILFGLCLLGIAVWRLKSRPYGNTSDSQSPDAASWRVPPPGVAKRSTTAPF